MYNNIFIIHLVNTIMFNRITKIHMSTLCHIILHDDVMEQADFFF